MDFNVRRAELSDVPRIAEIEKEAFSESWSEDMIKSCFCDEKDVFVLEGEGGVHGFSVLDRTLGDEAELHNIALSREMRGRRLSGLLMDSMLDSAREKGIMRIMLEVRVSNASAIALYSKYGFTKVGLRPGYYRHPTEDAYLMDLVLK